MMPEREFQQALADLIRRYDQAHYTSRMKRGWEREWHDLTFRVSDDQRRRMFLLLELHVQIYDDDYP